MFINIWAWPEENEVEMLPEQREENTNSLVNKRDEWRTFINRLAEGLQKVWGNILHSPAGWRCHKQKYLLISV